MERHGHVTAKSNRYSAAAVRRRWRQDETDADSPLPSIAECLT
jgi:hypothetical protein